RAHVGTEGEPGTPGARMLRRLRRPRVRSPRTGRARAGRRARDHAHVRGRAVRVSGGRRVVSFRGGRTREARVSDRILIEGIKFHGFHGLTKLERQVGVRLSVDVSLEIDLGRSARSDRIADTIDYRKVHARVLEISRARSHKLLESFGLALLDALLEEFPVD